MPSLNINKLVKVEKLILVHAGLIKNVLLKKQKNLNIVLSKKNN